MSINVIQLVLCFSIDWIRKNRKGSLRRYNVILVIERRKMKLELKNKIIEVCDRKILSKGHSVGLSFYAFFANKNDNPELLMEAATWWIMTHRLDHFEKAIKIKNLVERDF